MLGRVGIILVACAILGDQVNASWNFLNLDLIADDGVAKVRARRATDDFNVVNCTNPCTPTPTPGPEPTPTDTSSGETTDPGTTDPDDPSPTSPTPEGTIDPGDTPTPTSTTTDPTVPITEPGTCPNSQEFNTRLTYLFLILQNFDERTSSTFTLAIYNALNGGQDELSVHIRVILALQDGDLLMSLSFFQDQMSQVLTRHARITVTLKHILQGKIPTSKGVIVLHGRFPPSRKINPNNAILIVLSAMLRLNPALDTKQEQVDFANKLQPTEGGKIFINLITIIWSLQLGNDNDVACGRLYYMIQHDTIVVFFGREINFNNQWKDCDDSEGSSDESDLASNENSGSNESTRPTKPPKGSKESNSNEIGSNESGSKEKGSKEKGSKEKGSKEKGSKEKGSKERGSKENSKENSKERKEREKRKKEEEKRREKERKEQEKREKEEQKQREKSRKDKKHGNQKSKPAPKSRTHGAKSKPNAKHSPASKAKGHNKNKHTPVKHQSKSKQNQKSHKQKQ